MQEEHKQRIVAVEKWDFKMTWENLVVGCPGVKAANVRTKLGAWLINAYANVLYACQVPQDTGEFWR